MKKKPSQIETLSEGERELILALRQRPQMMARMRDIVEIARNEGGLKTADEVEELLIQEMRKLGNTTMREWASAAVGRVSQELHGQEPTLRSRKKKR
jgi:hypothetical protein